MKCDELSKGERYFQEVRTATFRKEEYSYVHNGIVDEHGETWTTTQLDEANIYQVYNQYRVRHAIPFPDEIKALRLHYGLSASKMSQILGFGVNQYRLYEDGEVPSISNARTLIAAREKEVFKSFAEASRAEMSDNEFSRTIDKIDKASGDFRMATLPSIMNGYKSLSIPRIEAVIREIVSQIGDTFVTKMNKMLFYTDFIYYRNHGFGITGIVYRALQFGPVPKSWATIYGSLKGVSMEEFVYPNGQSGIKLRNLEQAPNYETALNEDEIDTIRRVCKLFKKMNAAEISNISHQETAWISNQAERSDISYQDAFNLNYR